MHKNYLYNKSKLLQSYNKSPVPQLMPLRTFPYDFFLLFSVIVPMTNAASTKPSKNPNPGLKMYAGASGSKYRNSDKANAKIHDHTNRCKFCTKQKTCHQHKKPLKCKVHGVHWQWYINFINAPIAIKAANSAQVVNSFVFNFIFYSFLLYLEIIFI